MLFSCPFPISALALSPSQWKVMGAPASTNGPSADLKAAIDTAFGSIDEMKTKVSIPCVCTLLVLLSDMFF